MGEWCPRLPVKVMPNEWRTMVALTRAWTLREVARISGLPVSTVHRILRRLYSKGLVYFMVDMRKVNLLPMVAVFPKHRVDRAPPFTVSVREVYNMGTHVLVTGLVPPPFTNDYLAWFDREPVVAVRGYEYVRWSPLSPLSRYDPGLRALVPVFELEGAIEACRGPVERWDRGLAAPDVYDLVLLQGRMRNPFARPLKTYAEARARDPSLPEASEQVLSYHFTRHLKAMWRGNTAIVFADMRMVPVRVFYFEGKDAPALARALCMLPGAFGAVVEPRRALLIAQFPCSYDEHVMRAADGLDVEMPYYFVQSSSSIMRVMPRLWRYVEDGRWVFREELSVPVVRVALKR